MVRGRERSEPEYTGDTSPGFFDPQAEVERPHGARLPHWRQRGATYFVTFRTADSLPQVVLDAWQRQRYEAADSQTQHADAAVRRLFSEEIDRHLDAGAGECILARADLAAIVADCLSHFDGTRYRLWAWCVMPNHVHVLVEPLADYALSGILHTWKSFTAHEIMARLGRRGHFWQAESFDHLVRRQEAFEHFAAYIMANPERAGLENWPWRGTALGSPEA